MKSRLVFLKLLNIITLLSCFFSSGIYAQSYTLSGKVVNAKTGEPLAFVNLVANNSNRGTSTDIDGKFILKLSEPFRFVKFTSVGYESKIVEVSGDQAWLLVRLQEKLTQLAEVKIVAGENPAHRIIRNVLLNRNLNNPEKQQSFEYTSYNKLVFTSKTDSLVVKPKNLKDSSSIKAKSFFDKQHLLMMESVTKRKFLKPDKNYEEVLASRVSGFKNPIFAFIGSQMQSFSFYNERFNIFEKYYINPISNGCTSKYYYQIEDTLYSENRIDTVYVISYRPKRNTNFEGLKGSFSISTNRWAIVNAIAEPAIEQEKGVTILIQQKYELIEGKQWFPVQLNTDLTMIIDNFPFPFVANARAYLSDISLSPQIPKGTFSNVELEIKDSAALQSEDFWVLHRVDSLTKKELKTYHIIDSLGEKYNFEKKLNVIQALMNNKIPWGIVNFDIDKILNFNEYEKLRLGIGIHTSEKLFKWLTIGGYWGYGFGDKAHKYGADISFAFYKPWDLKLLAAYSNDLSESGSSRFLNERRSLLEGGYRDLFANYFDKTESSSIGISFRTLHYLQVKASLEKSDKTAMYPYQFSVLKDEKTQLINHFHITDFRLNLRYAYKEKMIKVRDNYIPIPNKYPIIYLIYTHGLKNVLGGDFDYQKVEFKIENSFYINYLGKTTFALSCGYADENLPYNLQFAARAGYNNAYIDVPNTFNTMRYNEFASNRYASLMFKHSFGSLLFRTKKFNPGVVILTNILYGSIDNAGSQQSLHLKASERGYFESGITINNLLKLNFYSLGIGAYYRYGSYALPKAVDNWTLKWTMTFPM